MLGRWQCFTGQYVLRNIDVFTCTHDAFFFTVPFERKLILRWDFLVFSSLVVVKFEACVVLSFV